MAVHRTLQPAAVAGWRQDLSGSPAVPLHFASGLVLTIVPVFAGFHLL